MSASEISHVLSEKVQTLRQFTLPGVCFATLAKTVKLISLPPSGKVARSADRRFYVILSVAKYPNEKGRNIGKNHLLKISKWLVECGDDLSYRTVARQVLSARQSLTSVFGMSTGGSSALLPPQWLYNPYSYGIYTLFSIVDD